MHLTAFQIGKIIRVAEALKRYLLKGQTHNITGGKMEEKQKKEVELNQTQKKRLLKIIKELRSKMDEIDELATGIESAKIRLNASPKKTKAMLEEIKVPALELLKEKDG